MALPSWLTYVFVALLITGSAFFSGLTLGLLGLDKIGLQIVASSDNATLAKYAKRMQPVRENGNLLLCTLLLGNVAVNALLSILLADLTSGLNGFFLSTALITIFGEIIPQAVCSRHALRIGYTVVPLVKLMVVLLYPFAKPLSMVLDVMLGDEIGTIHTRTELRELMSIHATHGAIDIETAREVKGALHYKDVPVQNIMTPIEHTFMLSEHSRLDLDTMAKLFKSGFSRIPVYGRDKHDVVGLLLVKDLIFMDPEDREPVRRLLDIFGRPLQTVWPDQSLGEVLTMFKAGRSHLAVVRDVNNQGPGDPFYETKGIITLEDIIEEILGDEIVDESDVFVDVVKRDGRKVETFDFGRLALLNGVAQRKPSALHPGEALAVEAFLQRHVAQCHGLSEESVKEMVRRAEVLEMRGNFSKENVGEIEEEDILYKRGQESQCTILILHGSICIRKGEEAVLSYATPWTLLGEEALAQQGGGGGGKGGEGGERGGGGGGGFKPDFTAHVTSESVRCLRFSPRQGQAQQGSAAASESEANNGLEETLRGPDGETLEEDSTAAAPIQE